MALKVEDIKSPADIKGLSIAELEDLAADVRRFMLENISETGGHIGANLGTVELSIALHYVLNQPDETVLFDTGHQGYTHKLMTGRANMFPSLNTYGGMNRFVSHKESEYDAIEASHAGTAISIGLGIALARKSKGCDDAVVAVVGDSAMAEGLTFEGLNHAVVEDSNLILLINDNGFAISPGFGGLHEMFQAGEEKSRAFFEAYGMEYIGLVDGHDVGAMIKALEQAKKSKKMPVIHARTVKGKGWAPADGHPFRMHFSFAFDPETGAGKQTGPVAKTYPDISAQVLEDRMAEDENIIAITPSTIYATGFAKIFERFPERSFDPGMEEQHALSMCVGLAMEGKLPVIGYQSTFLQRAYDQLIHDVCFTNLPVLILSSRSGFSGYDNPTHHGIYDIAYLRSMPNLKILYPKDAFELKAMMENVLADIDGPTMIMMPYGPIDEFDADVKGAIDVPEVCSQSDELMLLTVGNKFGAVSEVAKSFTSAGVVNLRCLKPLAEKELLDILNSTKRIVVIEEAVKSGGIGSDILALAMENRCQAEMLRIGLPCTFVEPGSNEELCEKYGLDAVGLEKQIRAHWPELG